MVSQMPSSELQLRVEEAARSAVDKNSCLIAVDNSWYKTRRPIPRVIGAGNANPLLSALHLSPNERLRSKSLTCRLLFIINVFSESWDFTMYYNYYNAAISHALRRNVWPLRCLRLLWFVANLNKPTTPENWSNYNTKINISTTVFYFKNVVLNW